MKAYNKAVDLAVYFDKIVVHFSKYHKYGIGIDMKKLSQDPIQLIVPLDGDVGNYSGELRIEFRKR